jgi:hypothetical protein
LIQGVVYLLAENLKAHSTAESQAASALEELQQIFEGMRRRLAESPAFLIVITELALRARRDPAIDKIGKQRDDFWSRRLWGIIERGVSEGVFRPNIHLDATVIALMAQLKGIAQHAAMRKRKPGELDAMVSEIAAQVEHWLVCRGEKPL